MDGLLRAFDRIIEEQMVLNNRAEQVLIELERTLDHLD